MAQDYYNTISGSRFVASDRASDLADENANLTNFTIGTDFILAVHLISNDKDTVSTNYKLQWQRSDEGVWRDLDSTGELNYTVDGATDLTDGEACNQAAGDWHCAEEGGESFSDAGLEREDSNSVITVDVNDAQVECQWAIATDDALANKTYEFRLDDSAPDIPWISVRLSEG